MLILPTQGKDFLRRCCTYFGIGGALILELTEDPLVAFFFLHKPPAVGHELAIRTVLNFIESRLLSFGVTVWDFNSVTRPSS